MKKSIILSIIACIFLNSCNLSKPEKTIYNLKVCIIAETTASANFAAYAEKARLEGYESLANLFEAASKAESIHAIKNKKILELEGEDLGEFIPSITVGTTSQNLEVSIYNDNFNVTTVYPHYLLDASADEVEKVKENFVKTQQAINKRLALLEVAKNIYVTQLPSSHTINYAVCSICGNIFQTDSLEDKCSICNTRKERFILFN